MNTVFSKCLIIGILALLGAACSDDDSKKQAPAPGTAEKQARPEFQKLDINGDGHLSYKEVSGYLSLEEFQEMDENGDGVLDEQEYSIVIPEPQTETLTEPDTADDEGPGESEDGPDDETDDSTDDNNHS